MKKIAFLIISFLCLFFIYSHFDNHKINYVSINDNSININSLENYNDYIYRFLADNNRLSSFNIEFSNNTINSIYKDLLKNRTLRINNNDYYFKKVLRESDIVVINVGMEELFNNYNKYDMNINNTIFNKLYRNIEELVSEIRRYAKGTVIFIGLYNPTNYYDASVDEFFYNIDIKLGELMIKNAVNYINLYELVKSNNIKDLGPFINNEGHKKLASIIEFYME